MFRIMSALLVVVVVLGLLLLTVSCQALVDPPAATPQPVTSAEREALHARWEAEAEASMEKYKSEVEMLRLELKYDPNYIQASSSARLSEQQQTTTLRIQELHETVLADMDRLTVLQSAMTGQQNAWIDAIGNHQAALANQALLLQGLHDQIKAIERNSDAAAENSINAAYNAEAAASNSFFTNAALVLLAFGLVLLAGLMMYSFNKLAK